jgi:hypothetical protein
MAVAASGLAQAGCGGGDDDGDDANDPHWLAQRASEVRELEFLEDVEVVTMAPADFLAQAAEEADQIDEAELEELASTYGRLGFFPIDADLRPILAGSSDWVAASYSPRTKVITVVEETAGDAPSSTEVHEYVHALQDQHFDLIAFDEATSTSDEYLAHRALVEGDATLAEARFVAQDQYEADLDGWDWPRLLDAYGGQAADLLAQAPYPLFVDYPGFVYRFGLEYTARNLLGDSLATPPPYDWSREDGLFTERPPATTQQVIRIDFEAGSAAEPVGLDRVPAELEGRLEALDWDTLGAWYAYLLFYRSPLAFVDASEVAPVWRGDRALFVRDRERDGAVATVWVSAWASEGDAFQVAGILDALYGRTLSGDSLYGGTASDGEPVWIEQRDDLVVAIKNLDPTAAETLAFLAFDPPVAPKSRRALPPLHRRLRDLVYRSNAAPRAARL